MSKTNEVPEVDIVVDEEAGVIREVKPQEKTRSKKGHERKINTIIYVILVLISIIWLAPFVFLVLQSFRSYNGDGAGGMVSYILPKEWSLDNYRFLFDGSDLLTWMSSSIIVVLCCAVIQLCVYLFLKVRGKRLSTKQCLMLACPGALLTLLISAISGDMPVVGFSDVVKFIVTTLIGIIATWLLGKSYLKTDQLDFAKLSGVEEPTHWEKFKKVAALFFGLGAFYLIMRYVFVPMKTSEYLRWYLNTLTIALFTAALQTIIVLSVSYALSRLRFKGRKLIMNAVLVLGLFPGFLTMITLYFLLKQMGLTQNGSIPGLILIYVASSGMGYYISKGFFDTIPKSLDESARIDGATRFQVFRKIIMPLAKPIVIYTILMAFMAPWGDYVFASFVAFRSKDNFNVAVGLYQWINTNDYQGYFTRFCAGGVLVALPITVLFLALQKYYVEGVTGGAVKG